MTPLGTARSLVAAAAFAALAVAALAAPPADADVSPAPLSGIHNDNGRLADDLGRTVLLRGINAVDKTGWDGAMSGPIVDDETIAHAKRLGFNHLRLGTTWASIEHERGSYDDAYIDQLLGTLDDLRDAGMVAVIDMHQDVWSEGVGFDGAPAWADPQCNVPDPVPAAEMTGTWFAQYVSPDVNAAWSNFWNDGYGPADPHCTGPIQSDFVEMWDHLASRLAGHPAIVGYDLLNEPWPSSPPGVFEEAQLMPMYRRVAEAIRRHDADTPVYFGPPLYAPALPTIALAPPDPNAVFAPHIYTETMFSNGAFTTDSRTDELALRKDVEEAHRLGVPLWIGEWGEVISARYNQQMYDLFDEYQVSSAFWRLAQYPGENRLDGREDGHVRIYAEAWPGDAAWTFDADTATFSMTVTVTDDDPAPVSLVVPAELDAATDDPAVTLYPADHRAIWTLDGPGTHTVTLHAG